MCTYNLLVWKWIDKKFDITWMYLCFIFVDTAFYLWGRDDVDFRPFYGEVGVGIIHGTPTDFFFSKRYLHYTSKKVKKYQYA